ncbi:hypothetical protein Tcan_07081 [Toxocara canis]|uniref:Tudor domain-containing protein n=1 Tax=Toxocara canis TaxID=6265 RepID=A0A0B2VY66_TOXCA|nr:hypothetical protein Tcan_07081 [Toxocara canis]
MVQDENFRVILIGKKPGDSSFKMFAIDVGETLQVDASQLRSDLPKSVRSPAPMCIRVNPKLGASQNDIDFFVSLQTGMTCMIEIDDLFLADFPQLMKELYPPEVTARVFKKDPGLCFSSPWRVVAYRRSRAHSGRRLEGGGGGRGGKKQEQRFRFRDFTITLPNRVNARVTRKLSSDTCIMRDTGLLDTLYDHIGRPCKQLDMSLCAGEGVGCLVRTMRRSDIDRGFCRPRLYRGLVLRNEKSAGRCIVSLIDYAEVVECEAKMVFDVGSQPRIVRDLPAAAFKFRAEKVDCPWQTEKKTPAVIINIYFRCLSLITWFFFKISLFPFRSLS